MSQNGSISEKFGVWKIIDERLPRCIVRRWRAWKQKLFENEETQFEKKTKNGFRHVERNLSSKTFRIWNDYFSVQRRAALIRCVRMGLKSSYRNKISQNGGFLKSFLSIALGKDIFNQNKWPKFAIFVFILYELPLNKM